MKTKFNFLNKIVLLPVFLFAFTAIDAVNWIELNNNGITETEITLISSTHETTTLNFKLNAYSLGEVTTSMGIVYVINAPNSSQILKKGAPALPKLTKSVIIPDKAEMQIEVISSNFIEIQNIDIAPSKGNLKRNIDPSTIPYFYGEEYEQDQFFPSSPATLKSPYILRDFRGQTVVIYPFRYNPVSKTLRIYTDITVQVSPTGNTGENILNRNKPLDKIDSEFEQIYSHHFINYASALSKYTPIEDQGNILIISYGSFISAMQPYIDWKKLKGIPTEIVDVSTIGDAIAIKNYVTDYYNTNGLTFLLLVGDATQVLSMNKSGDSDPAYGHIVGTDSYAEVFVGRFSAETIAQVETQVERTVNYEKYPDDTATWYNKHTLIASSEGPGDDNEMDYEHMQNIRPDLLGFTYTEGDELYDGSQGGEDAPGNPTATMLLDVLNDGRGNINYVGHGSDFSFVTTGFSVSDANNLTNEYKLPFIYDVACVNGNFHGQTCLAESFLRATYNSNPTGAIAMFASTINQSWAPPMAAQDEMIDIMIESYVSNIKRTFSGIGVNGCMLMNDEYSDFAMTDTWTTFGDPSLVVRTRTPLAMNVTHNPTIFIGANQFTVNCDVEDALVSLTIDGEIIGTGFISGGFANINFVTLDNVGIMNVTVTAFNTMPYLGSVDIVPNDGAYVICSNYTINDTTGNNNGFADFDENITLDVVLENVGIVDANNVQATLSASSPYIIITDSTHNFGNILASSSTQVLDAYAVTIANNVPDQHQVNFNLEIIDDLDSIWNSTFSITCNAPYLVINFVNINDTSGNNNGRLDPNETVDLNINTINQGHTASLISTCCLTSVSSYVTINFDTIYTGILDTNSTIPVSFNITIDPTTPAGTIVDFTFSLTAGEYSADLTVYKKVGLIVEDWESNDFLSFTWESGGNAPWIITSGNPYEGSFTAKSGIISDEQTSELSISLDVLVDDSVSFYKRVSCELGMEWMGDYYWYDFLEFFIDGTSQDRWDGEVNWSQEKYPVSSGSHTLKWVYSKDNMESAGEDCAWIDYIILPAFNNPFVNNAPVFTSTANSSAIKDSLYTYNITVYDVDVDDTLTITCTEKPNWLTFTVNGNNSAILTGTPADTGDYPVILSVTDQIADAQQSFIITVQDLTGFENLLSLGYEFEVYPNPANKYTTISFSLPYTSDVKLSVYNLIGEKLTTLVNNRKMNEGNHKLHFNCDNLKPGIYFCKMTVDSKTFVRKIVVL